MKLSITGLRFRSTDGKLSISQKLKILAQRLSNNSAAPRVRGSDRMTAKKLILKLRQPETIEIISLELPEPEVFLEKVKKVMARHQGATITYQDEQGTYTAKLAKSEIDDPIILPQGNMHISVNFCYEKRIGKKQALQLMDMLSQKIQRDLPGYLVEAHHSYEGFDGKLIIFSRTGEKR